MESIDVVVEVLRREVAEVQQQVVNDLSSLSKAAQLLSMDVLDGRAPTSYLLDAIMRAPKIGALLAQLAEKKRVLALLGGDAR